MSDDFETEALGGNEQSANREQLALETRSELTLSPSDVRSGGWNLVT
jgi:hypothetical protein